MKIILLAHYHQDGYFSDQDSLFSMTFQISITANLYTLQNLHQALSFSI